MSKVTNLNQFRKQQARVRKRAQGNENAARSGRSTAQKAAEATQSGTARQRLDQHRCERDE